MSALSAFVIGIAIGAFVAGMLVLGWAQERIERLEEALHGHVRRWLREGPHDR